MTKIVTRLRNLWAAWRGAQEGVSAIEFALITPVFLVLAIAMVDFSMAIVSQMQLQSAARVGAQLATSNWTDTSAISAAVTSATGLTVTPTVSVTTFCECSDGSTLADCTASCSAGLTKYTYAQVSVSANYTPIFNYPYMANPYPLSAASIMRVQ